MLSWAIFHLLLPTLAMDNDGPDETELPMYVGQAVCLQCHGFEHGAAECTVPPPPEHRLAFDALNKPEASEIALLSGVGPQGARSLICLGCHATGSEEGPVWATDTFRIEDGVQCEACHGAGSLHAQSLKPGNRPAIETGHTSMRSVGRWICGTCHRDLPSHQAVLRLGYRSPPETRLYKTPANLAVSPDGQRLFIVCENSDSLIVADPRARTVLRELTVGHRPNDVAVSPDGTTLFVTSRLGDSLTLVNAGGQNVIGEIPVGDDPHGVLTNPAGNLVFTLNTAEDSVSVVDTRTRDELRRLAAGRGPWSMALSPDGLGLYVTNVRPEPASFRQPHHSEITIIHAETGLVNGRLTLPDANMIKGIAFVRSGPHRGIALAVMMRTKNLVPATRLAQGWVITNALAVIRPDMRVDQVLLDRPGESFPDPNDVAVSPDGQYALVTSGGSNRVAVVDISRLVETIASATERERLEVLPNHLGLSGRFISKYLDVGTNPRGVAFSPDGRFAYVANAMDDSVSVIDTVDRSVTGAIDLGGPGEVSEIRRGERLFHSAEITFGRQFSCQSCHPDGHTNGLTMDIEADGVGVKPVDNRTLRGILDTAPFKWEGSNPSLSRQCGPRLAVFFTRLAPYEPQDLQALVRYLSTIERPPNRYRSSPGLNPAQYRGKLVFERATDNWGKPIPPHQRCITCHNGPYKTSQIVIGAGTTMWLDSRVALPLQPADVFNAREYGQMGQFFFADTGVPQETFDVPHLNNIYDSAPYLHNGAAPTLEEIWTRFNMLEGHGLTGDLTRQQFNDLMAYLRSL